MQLEEDGREAAVYEQGLKNRPPFFVLEQFPVCEGIPML